MQPTSFHTQVSTISVTVSLAWGAYLAVLTGLVWSENLVQVYVCTLAAIYCVHTWCRNTSIMIFCLSAMQHHVPDSQLRLWVLKVWIPQAMRSYFEAKACSKSHHHCTCMYMCVEQTIQDVWWLHALQIQMCVGECTILQKSWSCMISCLSFWLMDFFCHFADCVNVNGTRCVQVIWCSHLCMLSFINRCACVKPAPLYDRSRILIKTIREIPPTLHCRLQTRGL